MIMSEYRDYGSIGDVSPADVSVDKTRYGLVYLATHLGNQRLPYMRRSFISFTYGGKHIEDFNLIATIDGDRWLRDGYSSFEDMTTQYDNLEGQFYWNTHYKTNTINFRLSTDGIEDKMLHEFLHWFSAGISRELILAEHPNRAQMARVAEPPQLSLMPFEHQTTIMISGNEYPVTTTLYKGEISLLLIMDEPHWYAKDNILGKKITESGRTRYIDWWNDDNGNEVYIFASLDALKILLEDGIPLGSMIENNMLLGNSAYANVENNVISLIWSEPEDSENFASGVGAKIDSGNGTNGVIAGAIVNVDGSGISSLASDSAGYFFYAGTAPSPTKITFTISLSSSSFNENGYFIGIKNAITTPSTPYNTLTIESVNQLYLKFTTPNLFTSYNTAVKIIQEKLTTKSIVDVRKEIISKVRHAAVREWANKLLGLVTDSNKASNKSNIIARMKDLFKIDGRSYTSVTFTFNSKTGEAVGTTTYRHPTAALALSDAISHSEVKNTTEDVGDMLESNHIVIVERNYPNQYGKVVKWDNSVDGGKSFSHKITHDVSTALSNLQIEYQTMYL